MVSKFGLLNRGLVKLLQSGKRWTSKSCGSLIRLNFHEEVEAALNKQITEELTAAYVYFSMATVFGRDDVALPGFQSLFSRFATEEVEHAKGWVAYLNLRSGKAQFASIPGAPDVDWTPLCATAKAIDMEISMTKAILELRKLADKHKDSHLAKFIEDDYLMDQYEDLKELSDLKTQIERAGDGLGIHILDSDVLEKSSKSPKK